jgi:outer membrane lipase/esterase
MVVFGDSLSDSGNDALLVGSTTQVITGNTYIPGHPYAPGTTFSNGPVWASDAASAIGVPLLPSVAGGTNFAFGGATTGGPGPIPNLLLQANQYLGLTHNVASPNALYVIEGGGNNARAALAAIAGGAAPGPTILSTAVSFAANIGTIVDELQLAGAKHIVVWDTPNIGLAPASQGGGPGGNGFRVVPRGEHERSSRRTASWRSWRLDLRHFRSGHVDRTPSIGVRTYQRDRCLRGCGRRELQHV